jgi:very-short-patch-repair endonuclease
MWMAAVLACGRVTTARPGSKGDIGVAPQAGFPIEETVLDHWGAALSHRSAARLWGLLPDSDGPVDVSVPGTAGRRRRSGIRLHRLTSLLPAVVTLRDGIPTTTPARTVADLQQVSAAKGRQTLITPKELRRAIRQAAVLGLPVAPTAGGDRTRSDLERDFLRLCRRHGLPAPEVNVRIGRYLVDFVWRDWRLLVEADGYRYHRGQAAFVDDRRRDLALRAMGYEVVRLSEEQVACEPQQVAGALKLLLAAAANR